MDKKDVDIVEKYGAITQLRVVINSLDKTRGKDDIRIPGTDYLVYELKKLYNEKNLDILSSFAGAINQLAEFAKDVEKESEREKEDD